MDKNKKALANAYRILIKVADGINTFEKLVEETGLSRTTVNKRLKYLIKENMIKKELDKKGHIHYISLVSNKILDNIYKKIYGLHIDELKDWLDMADILIKNKDFQNVVSDKELEETYKDLKKLYEKLKSKKK